MPNAIASGTPALPQGGCTSAQPWRNLTSNKFSKSLRGQDPAFLNAADASHFAKLQAHVKQNDEPVLLELQGFDTRWELTWVFVPLV